MNNETHLNKLTCPQGHDVVRQPYGAYRCATCNQDYDVTQLKEQPIDKTGMQQDPFYKQKVYGRIS